MLINILKFSGQGLSDVSVEMLSLDKSMKQKVASQHSIKKDE